MSHKLETVTEHLNLPGELLERVPRLTMTGNRRLLVENRGELLSYSQECVELGCAGLHLRICGEALLLDMMDRDALIVTGHIASVEAERV